MIKGFLTENKTNSVPNNPPFDQEKHICVWIEGTEVIVFIDRTNWNDFYKTTKWVFTSNGYLMTSSPCGGERFMHRRIISPLDGQVVDHHPNHNKLDNRTCNLTARHPTANNHNAIRKNKTGFIGVKKCSKRNGFTATIRFNYKYIDLGYFQIAEEAARTYDKKAVEIYGSGARTNFPISDYVIPEKPLVDTLPLEKPTRKIIGTKCIVPGCPNITRSKRGYCRGRGHSGYWRRRETARELGKTVKEYAPRVKETLKTCIRGDGREVFSRNLCSTHYAEEREKEGYVKPEKEYYCQEPNCQTPALWRKDFGEWSGKLCMTHWREKTGTPTKQLGRPAKEYGPCSIEGCPETANDDSGLCKKHYLKKWREENNKTYER